MRSALIVFALIMVLVACGRPKPNNTIGLDIVWVDWSDDFQHVYFQYGYSSGKNPDSVVFICGFGRFWKKTPLGHGPFIIPKGIDSIVCYDDIGVWPDPKRYLVGGWSYAVKEEVTVDRGSGRVQPAGVAYSQWLPAPAELRYPE